MNPRHVGLSWNDQGECFGGGLGLCPGAARLQGAESSCAEGPFGCWSVTLHTAWQTVVVKYDTAVAIGRGASGEVFRAFDPDAGRQVAPG